MRYLSPASRRNLRLVYFVEQLKNAGFPSAESFARWLQRHGKGTVSTKTIKRDIGYLRDHLGAPVDYSPERHGYCLTDAGWTLPTMEFERDTLFAALFSHTLTHKTLPEPVSSWLGEVIRVQLAACHPRDLDADLFRSLVLATTASPPLGDGVFERVLQAWRECRRLRVEYLRPDDGSTPVWREIDVHGLFLADGAWYVRAFCHVRQSWRNLALHRMRKPEVLDQKFTRSADTAAALRAGNLFDYETVRKVSVLCDREKAPLIREREWFPGQQLTEKSGGQVLLQFPEVSRLPFIWWVLSYGGHLTVIAPGDLRREVRDMGLRIVAAHTGSAAVVKAD